MKERCYYKVMTRKPETRLGYSDLEPGTLDEFIERLKEKFKEWTLIEITQDGDTIHFETFRK